MEKLSDTTLKRLLDGNEKTINRFLNLSHSQQKLLTESSPEILNEFTNMLNLVNQDKETLDDFEFSLEPIKENLLKSVTKEKAIKLNDKSNEEFLKKKPKLKFKKKERKR